MEDAPTATTPVLIWGAGAMGGSIGAWLVEAGHDVLFVDQDAQHVEALNAHGLTIRGPVRAFHVPATAVLPDHVSGVFDIVLLCVKAHHTASALPGFAGHVSSTGCVVSVQNGLNESAIAEVVGAQRTVGAFVNFGADLIEPGVVMRGNRGAVVLGEIDGVRSERIERLQALFQPFEPDARVTDNIFGYLWSKLAYGALLFATATTHLSIADALDAPGSRPFFVALGREVCSVATAVGVPLEAFDGFDPTAFLEGASDDDALASLAALVEFNRGSAKTHSGIWRDLAVRMRPTEGEAQLGAVLDAARREGISVPLTEAVLEMIRDIEAGRRELATANLEELSRLAP